MSRKNNLHNAILLAERNKITTKTNKKEGKTPVKCFRFPAGCLSSLKLYESQNTDKFQSLLLKCQTYRFPQETSSYLTTQPNSMLKRSPEIDKNQKKNIPRLIQDHISEVTAKKSRESSRNIQSIIKTYGQNKMVKSLTSNNFLSKKNKQEKTVLSSMPPLRFSEEVLQSRGCSVLLPFEPGNSHRHIYKFKHLPPIEDKNKTKINPSKTNRNIYTGKNLTRHLGCLPKARQGSACVGRKPRLDFHRAQIQDKSEINRDSENMEHLWEKHVLGLLSKNTSQWIASQCAEGGEQDRLIAFLDEKYGRKGETVTVKKLVDINDDCLII